MFLPRSYPAVIVETFDDDLMSREDAACDKVKQDLAKQEERGCSLALLSRSSTTDTASIETPSYTTFKRVFDLTACICLLPFAAIILSFLTLFVFCSSGTPVFYRQERVGQNGRLFTLYKFRTMRLDGAEHLSKWFAGNPEALKEWKANHKLKDDPRIIRGGRFLRKTSLDELPQLFNVLRGEMTLVGPRPVVSAELSKYGHKVNFYLAAVPGLTGLWQVSGRCNVSYEQRVNMDEEYVRKWSFGQDISILLRTPLSVIRGDGAC